VAQLYKVPDDISIDTTAKLSGETTPIVNNIIYKSERLVLNKRVAFRAIAKRL